MVISFNNILLPYWLFCYINLLIPHRLVIATMEEQDEEAEPAIEYGEHRVQVHVLLVLGQCSDDPVCVDKGHDGEVCALRDLGAHQLVLVDSCCVVLVSVLRGIGNSVAWYW